MSASALQSLLSAGSPISHAPVLQGSDESVEFEELLQHESTARDAAMKLVSSSLVLPILSSIREGAFLEEPFKPGVMERRFGPLLDQAVADRITQASNFDLVDSIVKQIQSASNPQALEVFA